MPRSKKKRAKYLSRRYQQRGGAGAPPGQIVIHPDATPSKISVTCYDAKGITEHKDCSVSKVRELVGQKKVTWVDIVGLGSPELFGKIGELFAIHRLAMSDVAHTPQRPKLENFSEHLFLIVQAKMEGQRSETGQISFFLGKNFVISWQEFPGRGFPAVRERLQDQNRALRKAGPDYLLYALLDAVIDAYFPCLMNTGDELDRLEEQIYDRAESRVIVQLHNVRRTVRHLRSILWPLREAVSGLMADHEDLISDEVKIYLRDCNDHTYQLLDTLEIYRETCSDLRDYYATEVSNRMNEVMKVLTIISTIFIPLGFIAGVYGMNFDTEISSLNMPETRWRWGYPAVLGLMAMVTIGQLLFFRRKGWLGGSSKSNPHQKP